jgi:hypothetical protein
MVLVGRWMDTVEVDHSMYDGLSIDQILSLLNYLLRDPE